MSAKKGSEKYIKFLIYFVVVVLVNVVGMTLFFRIDLTENNLYSISKASKKVVSTLSEPLTIKVFFTKNLPAPYNNTERYLRDLLDEYYIFANSRFFNYQFYDVSAESGEMAAKPGDNQEMAKNYGIYPVQLQSLEKDEVKFQRAYMGLVIIHGDMIEKIPTISSTDKLEYQLTTAIQKLNNKISAFLRLTDKIQVKLYLSSSLKGIAPYMGLDRLPEIPIELEKIVEKVNSQSYGKINYEYIDPADPKLASNLKLYNLLMLKWPEIKEKGIPAGEGSTGLVISYGKKRVEIPIINVIRIPILGTQYQLAEMSQMEEVITKNIESLIDINEDIGYLADHDTIKLSGNDPRMQPGKSMDSATNFRSLAAQNYTVQDVKLSDESISDKFNCLIIAGPKERFTDYDLFQIDQHLMKGKNLAILLDSFNEVNDPNRAAYGGQPVFEPLNSGLEKLLEHYGVKINESYVLDESSYKQRVPQEYGGGERAIYFAPLIKKQYINSKLPFMSNIKGLIAMRISPLTLDTDTLKKNSIKADQIFASSERSWEMKGQINLNPMFIQPPPAEEQKSFPLAYILQGEFPSYFAGKPIPEKPEKKKDEKDPNDKINQKDLNDKNDQKNKVDLSKIEGEGKFIAKGKHSKIFVMASPDMIKDTMIDEEGKTPNSTFIMNVLDTLNNRDETAVMRSKEQQFNPLNDTTPTVKTMIKSFNIIGLPVLVSLFGLAVLFKRRARKNRIKEMFQK